VITNPDIDGRGWNNLNPVAEALTGWTRGFRRRGIAAYGGIVNTVDETNAQDHAPNPIEMVTARGAHHRGVAATMLLVRSDGRKIPIVQSAAPDTRPGREEIIGRGPWSCTDVSLERQLRPPSSPTRRVTDAPDRLDKSHRKFERRLGPRAQKAPRN